MDVVDSQLAFSRQAVDAGVLILPNCGLAPGMACVVASGGAKKFSRVLPAEFKGNVAARPIFPQEIFLTFIPKIEGGYQLCPEYQIMNAKLPLPHA